VPDPVHEQGHLVGHQAHVAIVGRQHGRLDPSLTAITSSTPRRISTIVLG